jgi:protein subunit release factor B
VDKALFLRITPKDCDREVFRSGGKGGQNQNKVSSGVRWRHRASGATGESRQSRSQEENGRIAWRRTFESLKFKSWLREQHFLADGVDEEVKRAMKEENIKVEYKRNGIWEEA